MRSEGEHLIRLLIVSDLPLMRAGLRRIIESEETICVLGEISVEKASAPDPIVRQQTDLVLVDYDPCNPDILVYLQNTYHNAAVLILTDLADRELARKALSLGTAGIVLKIQPPSVLIAAIKDLCPRLTYEPFGKEKARELNGRRTLYTTDIEARKKVETLTVREREIIGLLGLGLKNKDIANRLSISDITVRHHLTSVFCKLEVEDRQKLLILAHRHGLANLTLRMEPA